MTAIAKNTEKNILLVQLRRKRTAVVMLINKLESYQFAPKTHSRFEEKANLISELDRFANSMDELLEALQINDIKVMNYIEDVERQFEDFNSLHQGITEYTKVV